jgi:hypothetical protein
MTTRVATKLMTRMRSVEPGVEEEEPEDHVEGQGQGGCLDSRRHSGGRLQRQCAGVNPNAPEEQEVGPTWWCRRR